MKITETYFERELKFVLATIHKTPSVKQIRSAVKSLKFAVEYDKPSREALGNNLNHVQSLIQQKPTNRQQFRDFFIELTNFVRPEILETWPDFRNPPQRKATTFFEFVVLDINHHFDSLKRSYPNCQFIAEAISDIEYYLKRDVASRYQIGKERLPDALALLEEQKLFWKLHGKRGWMLQEYFFTRYLEFLPMHIRWLPWN